MNPDMHTENERINLRLKRHAKRMLERAASFEGQTISEFVLKSALIRAEKTIQKHEVIILNKKDSDAFFNALATTPIQFNHKLTAALDEHGERVISK